MFDSSASKWERENEPYKILAIGRILSTERFSKNRTILLTTVPNFGVRLKAEHLQSFDGHLGVMDAIAPPLPLTTDDNPGNFLRFYKVCPNRNHPVLKR